MDACSLRKDQQCSRTRWWRSRLCSKTGGPEQGRSVLRHSAVGGLTQIFRRGDRIISTYRLVAWHRWRRTTWSSNAHRPADRPANGMTTITTCWRMASLSAASSTLPHRQWDRRGCGRLALAITRIARRLTATRRRARPRWRGSPKAGGGNDLGWSHRTRCGCHDQDAVCSLCGDLLGFAAQQSRSSDIVMRWDNERAGAREATQHHQDGIDC